MRISPPKMRISPPKILDFDIETRPLSFMGGGFTTDEITSIACSFVGEDTVNVFQMHYEDMADKETWTFAYFKMLSAFVDQYNQADIVTGHYIRAFDLPKINGALVEVNAQPLSPKVTIDTKIDLITMQGISKSQENLGAMLSYFNHKKHLGSKEHMSQMDWRWANRLTDEGVDESLRRVAGDVRQHKELRLALVAAKALKKPRTWRP